MVQYSTDTQHLLIWTELRFASINLLLWALRQAGGRAVCVWGVVFVMDLDHTGLSV